MNLQNVSSLTKILIVLLIVAITKVCSKSISTGSVQSMAMVLPTDNQIDFTAALEQVQHESKHQREKRSPYDPYDVYYFYPSSLNDEPAPQHRYDTNSYINRRDTAESNRIEEETSGKKYKYRPLFQYKSTQSKRRKLFVPNLFG